MSQSLALRRTYLDTCRRMIVGRALAGAALGLLPLPYLDDWTVGKLVGSGYRRIAHSARIDLEALAEKALVQGDHPSSPLPGFAWASLLGRLATRASKRVLAATSMVKRANAASRTFVEMTLFHHYCAQLHVGGAIDVTRALEIRLEIERTLKATPGALVLRPLRLGLARAVRGVVKAPLKLANTLSGGTVRKLLTQGDALSPVIEVDAFEAQLTSDSTFGRLVASLEAQLTPEANPFLEYALADFDRRWRARMATLPR